ncbi:MAG: 23S rRNA (pseudouridine(1915)-N(3))-methyltransferase RlmH [Candidatus Wallbacteria bacterium HGW-Wallbacteria-1]|jgi:23S rRNA (pseudouridine1915-N3)-methyltransferase|uniref:Ribosomal RNA large subunit methyltransferase H n=1 Tax=Candidatus Wallbacteria bacterium HGW-Wallbacteria-1 TaxID=2013854 RepID=A0A2N1PMQ4_9BACT|nr:MAG: 23S rRNA (pseudouridine(1915)-N(3))-methyltransferase RlmH [Candidatus Wallbacteria bacterium HGW-Wallbacteria-1]
MNVNIICVGKIREKFYRDALTEYSKRISRFCNLRILEVSDEQIPEKCSVREMEIIRKREAEKIESHIKPGSCTICLDISGKSFDSESFARKFQDMTHNSSTFNFIIGGSIGLHDELLAKADLRLSFSQFTFPHQLMRVILAEQLFRWFKIMNNETYHK